MNDEDRIVMNVLMRQYYDLSGIAVKGVDNELLNKFLKFYEDELFKSG
jgi:hypothetical protein